MSCDVLILGADGFIGRHLCYALRRAGWRVIASARRTGALDRMGFATVRADLTDPATHAPRFWADAMRGCHLIIAAGLLTGSDRAFRAVHLSAPAAALQALPADRQAVLISAVGIDGADTRFARWRREAESMAAPHATILRAGLVVADTSYGGSSLLRALAALPLVAPVIGDGAQRFNPIHADDLARVAAACLTDPPGRRPGGGAARSPGTGSGPTAPLPPGPLPRPSSTPAPLLPNGALDSGPAVDPAPTSDAPVAPDPGLAFGRGPRSLTAAATDPDDTALAPGAAPTPDPGPAPGTGGDTGANPGPAPGIGSCPGSLACDGPGSAPGSQDGPDPGPWEIGGPETVTQAQLIAGYRAWLGLPPARPVHLPLPLAHALGRIGDALDMGPVSSTAVAQLQSGVLAAPAPLLDRIPVRPRGLTAILQARPAGTQDLWQARLYLLKPAIRLVLALMWLASGLLGLLLPAERFLPLFATTALPEALTLAAARAGGAVDLALALALLRNWRPVATAVAQIAVVLGYTIALTLLVPGLWLAPFGELLKNLPILALLLVHLILARER